MLLGLGSGWGSCPRRTHSPQHSVICMCLFQAGLLSLPARPSPTPPHLPRSHTSRFLIIWLTMLPFALYGSCGASTVPLTIVISFLLLGEPIGAALPCVVWFWAGPHPRLGTARYRTGSDSGPCSRPNPQAPALSPRRAQTPPLPLHTPPLSSQYIVLSIS